MMRPALKSSAHEHPAGSGSGKTGYSGFAQAENERLAQLRALLSADRTLDASRIEIVFRDGAVHLAGLVRDERSWFAIVNVASTFATQVVDRIRMESRSPPVAAT